MEQQAATRLRNELPASPINDNLVTELHRGEAPRRVMAQMGPTSPQLALAIYAREMDRRDGEPERLRALVSGELRALTGTGGEFREAEPIEELAA